MYWGFMFFKYMLLNLLAAIASNIPCIPSFEFFFLFRYMEVIYYNFHVYLLKYLYIVKFVRACQRYVWTCEKCLRASWEYKKFIYKGCHKIRDFLLIFYLFLMVPKNIFLNYVLLQQFRIYLAYSHSNPFFLLFRYMEVLYYNFHVYLHKYLYI